ncbi:MAG: hypothetical protein DI537_19520 [Stutzerimonas stutzeri]|jgi:hypothetical protein|nr:MAG: hypothetical protein DI537_19520 [Stutzerimonas stutzeri]
MTDKKPAMDFTEAFKAFDPASLFPFMNAQGMADWFRRHNIDGLDPASMMRLWQQRLDALARANEHATSLYHLQIQRQFQILDEMTAAATESMKRLDTSTGSEAPANNLKILSEAADKALALMQRLSEETLAAVTGTQKRFADEVEAAVKDLRGA